MSSEDELRFRKISVKVPREAAEELMRLTQTESIADAIVKVVEDLRRSITLYEEDKDLLDELATLGNYFESEEEKLGVKTNVKSLLRGVVRAVKSQLEAADEFLYKYYGYEPTLQDKLEYLDRAEKNVVRQVRLIFAYLRDKAREIEKAKRQGARRT
jgi:hypothetical protein